MNRTQRRVVLTCVLASAGTLASAAASGQAPALMHKDGLLLLPNVRIEAAPAALATRGTRVDAGLRAYRDEQTGGLRQITAEELLQEALQQQGRANDPAGAVVVRRADGSLSAQLDDSFLSSAVVQRQEDGALVMQCVPGDSQASGWLTKALAAKETRRDK